MNYYRAKFGVTTSSSLNVVKGEQNLAPQGPSDLFKSLAWIGLNFNSIFQYFICVALHDLVPFVQFKKGEKQPRRSISFTENAGVFHIF